MHTLFDFISKVNGIQYIIALLSIPGFIVFSEILKAKPFAGLRETVAEDLRFIKDQEKGERRQMVRNTVMAPIYFFTYLASLPVLFVQGMAEPVGRRIGSMTSVGWSPVRAYFTGRGKKKKTRDADSKKA